MQAKIGVMITSKCDFRCDHCMFSCTNRGKHMDDETLRLVGNFIRSNNIYDVSIYGGEPFVDMEHFKKCADELYDHGQNFFISTNGSFLASPKRLEAVRDWCVNKFRYNEGEISGIRISNTTFHKKNRSDLQQRKLDAFSITLKDPSSYGDYFPMEDNDDFEYYSPFTWSESRDHTSESMFYIDRESSFEGVNPSGRALTTGSYYGTCDHEISCVVTAKSYEDFDELWDDMGEIEFYPNGDIGICCYCKSGTIGNVRDFSDVTEIKNAVKKFRQQMRLKGKVNKNQMQETCDNCRKCRILQPVQRRMCAI